MNDIFSDVSEVNGVTVDWFQYDQVCQISLIKRSLSFVRQRDAGQIMLHLVDNLMEMPHLPFWLSSFHGQQTFIYYGWGPGNILKSF